MSLIKIRSIFIIGPIGAGKSTIGKGLANALKLDFYDSDAIIQKRAGADLTWIFDIEGEDGLRAREEKIIDEITQKSNIVLSTGADAVMSGAIRNILSARGLVLYLKVSPSQQLERTKMNSNRPLLHTNNIEERLEELRATREPLYEELAEVSFDADKGSIKSVINNIVNYLYHQDQSL